MGCCAKYAAKLILSLSALAFLALSVVLMYVSVSAFDSPFFEGVVAAVAVGGVVLSLLTAVVACTGCAALLSCKRPTFNSQEEDADFVLAQRSGHQSHGPPA